MMQNNNDIKSSVFRKPSSKADRLFGLRIEGRSMQLAIASRQADGTYAVELDLLKSSIEGDWLTVRSGEAFVDAFRELVEKHQMRRGRIAISLDGDYCVTRVAMGSPEHVDKELGMLLGRATRYLSLGPGLKIAGTTRNRTQTGTDYAAAAVINQSIIERIYDTMQKHDMNVHWVEPSLVSFARMIDTAGIAQDEPLLIADGTGSRWDLGIVHCGRLLLDYRPAAARTVDEIRVITESHIERLRRFCSRHRNIVGGTLSRVLVVGSGDTAASAKVAFETIKGLSANVIEVPVLPNLFHIATPGDTTCFIPAISSVLPMIMGTDPKTVPDMLAEIRRDTKPVWHRRLISEGWPAMAAAVCLLCGYSVLSAQRAILRSESADLQVMEAELASRYQKIEVLSKQRQKITFLKSIEKETADASWRVVLEHVTQCLPEDARVNQFQYDDQQGLRVDGAVRNESNIYDFVGNLRRLPEIKQVALQETSPLEGGSGATFRILLQINSNAVILKASKVEDLTTANNGPPGASSFVELGAPASEQISLTKTGDRK